MKEKRPVLLVLTAILICLLIIKVNSFNTMANESSQSPYCYSSIQIQTGDSLWSIAQEYSGRTGNSVIDYLNTLKKINGLEKDTIHAGHYLTVYYSTPADLFQ